MLIVLWTTQAQAFSLFKKKSAETQQIAVQEKSTEEIEDELRLKFDSLKNSTDDALSVRLNKSIKNTLKKELRQKEETFDYPYSKLQYLGKCYSNDQKVRVYSWMFPKSDGTYQYECLIQTKKKKSVTLTEFQIKKNAYTPKQGSSVQNSNWYGALYYQVVAPVGRKGTYTLLGWGKGTPGTEFKVAESMNVEKNGTVKLGKDSRFEAKGSKYKRLVLQYSDQAHITMDYVPEYKSIVFDHLIPSESIYKGIYSYYGPDFTYDEYTYQNNGRWTLQENVDMKNKE